MRRLQVIVASALLVLAARTAFAESVQGGEVLGIGSDPFKIILVTADTASVGDLGAGRLIFGFKLYANDAGDYCALYDTAVTGGMTNANLIDENFEPTDEDVTIQVWPRPYKLVTDLTVHTNGTCIIYYQ